MMIADKTPTHEQAIAAFDLTYKPKCREHLLIDNFSAQRLFGVLEPTCSEVAY